MTTVTYACEALLSVAALLVLLRLLRGPTVPDRIVALDALLVIVATGIAVDAARTGESTYLPVLVVVALLAFIGTVTAARFVERRGP